MEGRRTAQRRDLRTAAQGASETRAASSCLRRAASAAASQQLVAPVWPQKASDPLSGSGAPAQEKKRKSRVSSGVARSAEESSASGVVY